MECVRTVSYSLIIKGSWSKRFFHLGVLGKRILSPYLFLLVIDVLSRLIQVGIENKSLMGIKLSNLLFAHDYFLLLLTVQIVKDSLV